MSDAYLDDDGYPTDAAIQRLTEWGDPRCLTDTPEFDVNGAIDFMRLLWWMPESGVSEMFSIDERNVYQLHDDRRYVKMSTGGWSGNEDLMQSFCERWWRNVNVVVRRRGGHYVLEYEP
jgi:hypothetical protein